MTNGLANAVEKSFGALAGVEPLVRDLAFVELVEEMSLTVTAAPTLMSRWSRSFARSSSGSLPQVQSLS